MSKPESRHSPYPGLRPFEEHEADLFFGREKHVDALLKRLSNSHFVAVVGESGAGKSSLVRAGLLPALEAGFVVEAGSDWRIAVMRPGGAPLTALADALLMPRVLSESGGEPRQEFALAELRRGPLGLVQLVRDAHLPSHCNLLVVVDQFEELFRYCRDAGQKDQANVFVELLLEAAAQRAVPILVVLTMRSDFIGDCARFRGLPERLNDNQFLTPRLTREQIAEAICGPARVCGGVVEASLVDELCNAVGDNQDQLPLLQHLLMRLWERASAASNPPRLTTELSRAMGGLHSALNNHAQQIYDSLSSDENRAVARALFKSLTDPHSQRRDLRRDALVTEVAAVAATPVEPVIAVANEFRAEGRHMLMPPPAMPLGAASRLDISHESLIRQWSALNEWAGEEASNAREFERLREEARREQEGQGELLSGRDLVRAIDWLRQARPSPGWAERYSSPAEFAATLDFIRRSEEQEKRRKDEELSRVAREAAARRSRYYNWVFGALFMLAAGLAGWSYNLSHETDAAREKEGLQRARAEAESKKAQEQAQRAEENAILAGEQTRKAEDLLAIVATQNKALARERSQARSRHLSAQTMLELHKDPAVAVVLAREALLEDSSEKRAVQALRKAIAEHVPSTEAPFPVAKMTNYIPGSNKSSWLDFSLSPASLSAHNNLAIIPSGNSAVIWPLGSGEKIRTLLGHKNIVASAAFSPDGRLAVTTSADATARVWDVSTGTTISHLKHSEMINGAIFSPDGQLLVTLGDDEAARVWKLGQEAPRCELKHAGNFIAASFTRDGKYLATVTHQTFTWQVQVWDFGHDNCPRVAVPILDPQKNKDVHVKWATFSPDSAWLGLVTVEGKAIIVSTGDWQKQAEELVPPVLYPAEAGREDRRPPAIAWNRNGSYYAAAGGDNVVRVQAVGKRVRPIELRGHTGRITSIAFHPQENLLVTTSDDKTARVWKLVPNSALADQITLRGHGGTVGSAVFSQNGREVVTAADDGRARLWKVHFPWQEKEFPELRAAAFAPDGKRIWVAGREVSEAQATGSLETLRTFKIPSSKIASSKPPEPGSDRTLGGIVARSRILARALGERGELAFYASPDRLPMLIETRFPPGQRGGTVQISVHGLGESAGVTNPLEANTAEDPIISPDGRFVVVNEEQHVRIWDVTTPQESARRMDRVRFDPKDKNLCRAMAIAPKTERLAWYCADSDKIQIVRTSQGQRITAEAEGKQKVTSMRFSRSGLKLAIVLEDNSVQVLDSATGKTAALMRGHTGPIQGIDFSFDDGFVATVSSDSTARVWDAASGEQIAALELSGRLLMGVSFSPDALSLLLSSWDRVWLWRCHACGDANTLLEEVRRRRIRPALTEDEQLRLGLSNGRLAAVESR